MKEPLGVIGAGWVGLVTAACFADLGHEVVVRDVVPERIAELEAGRVPIYEPGLAELLAANRERIRYTLDMADVFERARMAFVCVDTPPTHSGDADLSRVSRVVEELPDLGERIVLVMKSTVPVGTGALVRERLDRVRPCARRLRLEPGVPGRRQRSRRLPKSRPRRHRGVRRRGRGRRRRPLRRSSTPPFCGRTSRRRKWSRWPRTRSSRRASASSTRSQTCAR